MKITKKDLKSHTIDNLMTETYGPKGTKKRTLAEVRINKLAKNLIKTNKAKIKKEK